MRLGEISTVAQRVFAFGEDDFVKLQEVYVIADNEALWAEGRIAGGTSPDRCCNCTAQIGKILGSQNHPGAARQQVDPELNSQKDFLLARCGLNVHYLVAVMHDQRAVLRDVFNKLFDSVRVGGRRRTKTAAQHILQVNEIFCEINSADGLIW